MSHGNIKTFRAFVVFYYTNVHGTCTDLDIDRHRSLSGDTISR